MLVQDGGMLDQCSTRIVTCSSIAIPGSRDARSGSWHARRCHGDTEYATTAGLYRLVKIALNNRGM